MGGMFLPVARVRQTLFVMVESALLVAVLLAAVAWRFGDAVWRYDLLLPRVLLTTFLLQLCLYYTDLYEDRAMRWRMEFIRKLGQAFLAGTLLLSLVYYVFPAVSIGRGILFFFLPAAALVVFLLRSLYQWAAGREALCDNVLMVGSGVTAQQCAMELLARAPLGYRVVGFLGEHPAEVGRRLVNPSVIGTMADLPQLVEKLRVNLIVVALQDRRGKMPLAELLACRTAGVSVEEGSSFYERVTGKILLNNLRPSWLVFSRGFSKPRLLRNSKRVGEFLAALVLLLVSAPLFGLIALAVRLEGRGPVFYPQERVGEKGRRFNLIKFRTMRVDAEANTGPVWVTAGGDRRVTRVGRWLRKSRLDELPQLLNVLRGEMSFVGPRPERPHFVEQFRKIIPYYDIRHSVKPGITGWAQVRFRYGSTFEDAEEKLQFDLYYIKRMSALFDLSIILDTVKVVLFGKGAR